MSIAFVTMTYNDDFFLNIWVNHYAKFVDRSDLHIITHGPQPQIKDIVKGCTVLECPRDPDKNIDHQRFPFIMDYCKTLFADYEWVIFNDVDEVLVLDPIAGDDMAAYIRTVPKKHKVISSLGLEIIHRQEHENDYDYSRPMFSQRKWVRANGWYSKPNTTRIPLFWGPDGHGSSHGKLYLDENMYLFHMKWFDTTFHIKRYQERVKLKYKDEHGTEHFGGAGSWAWTENTYKIMTNSHLRLSEDRLGLGFNFDAERKLLRDSFGPAGPENIERYKASFFVRGDLREIPERFVGII